MAISVEFLYNQTQDLAAKNQSGYQTTEEFNNSLLSAQNAIFKYYYQQFEQTQEILDALRPFIKTETLSLTPSAFYSSSQLPSDYRHRLEVSYVYTTNNDCGQGVTSELQSVDYMQTDEVASTLSNAIRKPSIPKKILRHTLEGNLIKVFPPVQSVDIKYLRNPITPVYATTLVSNADGDFEQFDAANSVDLEWGEQETETFINVLLMQLGFEIKDSELIQYSQLKRQFLQ